jgi:hypothetical protein
MAPKKLVILIVGKKGPTNIKRRVTEEWLKIGYEVKEHLCPSNHDKSLVASFVGRNDCLYCGKPFEASSVQ